MKKYISENFLLQNPISERLFHEVARDLPIIDFHNHLNPGQLLVNGKFQNITQLWIDMDPYKHRAMRVNGIPEKFITGSASDKDKFISWAKTIRSTVGNPLHHWAHMELKKAFGIDQLISEANATSIWEECNRQLVDENLGEMDLLKKWNVETICTSDDLLVDVSIHEAINLKNENLYVLPSLRGDTIIQFESERFPVWLEELSELVNLKINDMESYIWALIRRLDRLDEAGCQFADQSLDADFSFNLPDKDTASLLFEEYLKNGYLHQNGLIQLKSYLLKFLGEQYALRNWTLQLHVGAQRHTSTRLCNLVGVHGGFASIGKPIDIESICMLLDSMEQNCLLPKIILFNLNPSDNASIASITGSFVQDEVKGKIQFGPPWWYNDHVTGIMKHLQILSDYGFLSHFIGMTTDSRSLLSFSRHEYFRRVLCKFVGEGVERGVLPNDRDHLEELVRNISYQNCKNWITNKHFTWKKTTKTKLL